MNTIPTIFNEKITPYAAIGGKERTASTGISAVILNNNGTALSRRHFFQELEKTGFDNVISIESPSPHYDIEELSKRFPFVRFILPENKITLGEQINLAASEIESPLFFVLRSDIKIIAGGIAKKMAERLTVNEEKKSYFKRLCTVPLLLNQNYETIPTLAAPATHKRKIQTIFLEPFAEESLSLYPFDGIGIYDKQRFVQTGGFDATIKNQTWQLMDFGFRAFLWGEEIAFNFHFKLLCSGELPPEDFSINENYSKFFLKNLAPVFKSDYAHLPIYRFWSFLLSSEGDPVLAWKEFSKGRKWVKINKFRWRRDAYSVTNLWDKTYIDNIQEKKA